jgi:hypothetical protein
MRLLLLGIELPNVTAVQGLHHADPRKHRRPFRRRHQNSRLYNDAREVRDRLFVDDRWFRFSVAGFSAYFCQSGSLGKKMPYPSKRSPQRQANSPMGWAWNTSEPLRIASQWGKGSWTNKENDMKKTLIIAAAAMLAVPARFESAGFPKG